jgi:hypothetical protein
VQAEAVGGPEITRHPHHSPGTTHQADQAGEGDQRPAVPNLEGRTWRSPSCSPSVNANNTWTVLQEGPCTRDSVPFSSFSNFWSDAGTSSIHRSSGVAAEDTDEIDQPVISVVASGNGENRSV